MDTESITELLEIVREKVNIKEGKRGLIKFLAVISRFPNSPIKLIAQKSGFPVPICTAIRNEFIKVKWCKRTPKGTILTKEGEKVLKTIGGLNIDLQCFSCNGLGINLDHQRFQNQLETIKTYAKLRGPPNTKIDQSFATPETSLNRVLYMSHHYDLLYGDFAFIGDSDLTSIALSQFVSPVQKIVVFDIDLRVKEIIDEANSKLEHKIEFVEHDFRNPIPQKYKEKFRTVTTDPPYTRIGVSLFISRALELIDKEEGGVIYLSFVPKPPEEMLEIEQDLIGMNCLITDIASSFNKYVGAQKLAGKSTFYRLLVIPPAKPLIQEPYTGKLYTGDFNPRIRIYTCLNCKKEIKVGRGEKYPTIERLKRKGCPHCSQNRFRKEKESKIE
ncbi:MAG: bis-aminopropyl spermidine synthase family protein [Candidatus Heimdallarchaeaceae archaeon]